MLFSKKKKTESVLSKTVNVSYDSARIYSIRRSRVLFQQVHLFFTYLLVLESCFVFLVLDSSKLISIHRDKVAKFI